MYIAGSKPFVSQAPPQLMIQKMRREPGWYHVCNDVLCMVLCIVVWVIELSPTHGLLVTLLEISAWCHSVWQEGILERLQGTTVSPDSDCYNMNTGIVYTVFSSGKFVVANKQWASHTIYFRETHRSCVESADQIDTCRETKYLSSMCISMSMWNTDNEHWASYAG